LVSIAVRLHPLPAIVAAEVFEKVKGFAGEHGLLRCHGPQPRML